MKRIFLFFTFFTVFQAAGMESPDQSPKQKPKACRILFSTDENIRSAVIQRIREIKPGGIITAESPFLGDAIVSELKKAAKKGVEVKIQSSHSRCLKRQVDTEKNSKEAEDVLELQGEPGHHVKRITLEDPRKPGLASPKKTVFCGSDNWSNISWAHKELMMEIKDQVLCKAHIEDANYNQTISSPVKGVEKIVVIDTPKKKEVYNSQKYNSLDSLSMRILTMMFSDDPSDSIDITSMTFDSQKITKVLVTLKEMRPQVPVRLILDRAALKHKDLLDKLDKVGVMVFIFNADGKEKIKAGSSIPKLQHTKTVTRRCGGKELTIVSTGNLTKQSSTEVNVDTYLGSQMFEEIRAFNDKLITECMHYKADNKSESEESSSSESESSEA